MNRNMEFDMGLPPDPLAAHEQNVLQYAKETAGQYVTDEDSMRALGIPAELFYRKLSRMIDDPAAMAHDPEAVEELRQARAAGTAQMTDERQ